MFSLHYSSDFPGYIEILYKSKTVLLWYWNHEKLSVLTIETKRNSTLKNDYLNLDYAVFIVHTKHKGIAFLTNIVQSALFFRSPENGFARLSLRFQTV